MTVPSPGPATERADAARNRARLLEAAARLVAERGAGQVTMQAVAEAAGVGKGTLFRRFGDRDGLLLALLDEAEEAFQEAYTSGPPPLGPGVSAADRLAAFGCALLDRATCTTDRGMALVRHVDCERRSASRIHHAFHGHVTALLREAGGGGDPEMLAFALLAFADIDLWDRLMRDRGIPVDRIRATWLDLVGRMTGTEVGAPAC
ncbi:MULTISPECIES: TetR/AcrR family transcriptional regulator [unclassified Streptomyces]|uniref:TetR/AcrR family transcriptional regulator n=1 Tax=unclassified Streptomyces TaxID=2593676 RepID=UPI00343D3F2F